MAAFAIWLMKYTVNFKSDIAFKSCSGYELFTVKLIFEKHGL